MYTKKEVDNAMLKMAEVGITAEKAVINFMNNNGYPNHPPDKTIIGRREGRTEAQKG